MKEILIILSLALLLIFPLHSSGANPDSLYLHFQETLLQKKGYAKLNLLASKIRADQPDSCLKYAGLAFERAKHEGDLSEQSKALNIMGLANRYLGNYSQALDLSFEALLLSKANNGEGTYRIFTNIGLVYKKKGRYDFAFEYFEKALELTQKLDDPTLTANVLNNIGNTYRQKGDFESALHYLRQTLDIRIQQNDELGIAACYNNLGNIYEDQKNTKLSLVYYKKALEIKKAVAGKQNIGIGYLNLGGSYLIEGHIDSALFCIQEAEKCFLETKNYPLLTSTYTKRGVCLEKLGKVEEGKAYLKRALEMCKARGMTRGIGIASEYLGLLYLNQKEYKKAISYFLEALEIAQHTGAQLKIAVGYENLSQAYNLMGDHDTAYHYLMLCLQTRDSIPLMKSEDLLNDIQAKYNLESWEKEYEILKKDQDIFYLKVMGLLFLGLLILAACIAIIFRNRYRYHSHLNEVLKSQRKKVEYKNKKLALYNSELKQFAHAVSHDLKQPLRTIGSFASLIERRYSEKLDTEAKEFISYMTNGVYKMDELLGDLLAFSQIDQQMEARKQIDLNEVIVEIMDSEMNFLFPKDITFQVEYLPTVYGNPKGIRILFSNLIQNAIKFSENDPIIIKIKCEEKEDHYKFSISDNGIGIDPVYAKKVFSLFQRLHPNHAYDGNGSGLAISKKVVTLHGGEITFDSKPGQGSTFYITLPKIRVIQA